MLGSDESPDAHAARLHFALCTGLRQIPSWDLVSDLAAYVIKFSGVSANCRVTLSEEIRLLEEFQDELVALPSGPGSTFISACLGGSKDSQWERNELRPDVLVDLIISLMFCF